MKPNILSISLTSLTVLVLGLVLPQTRTVAQSPNPIVLENQKPGDSAWQFVSGGTRADDIGKQIKGYASATSVNKGGLIDFKISVAPAQAFSIEVWRMGYYGGTGGRLVQTIGPLNGAQQPACPIDATTGLTECNWSTSYTLAAPADWTTGVYLAKLVNAQNFYSYIIFVVRDDNRIADFLYQQPVMTYQAYNNYPNDNATGKSLYETRSFGANTIAGTSRAVRVSFDRPYADAGLGDFGLGDYGWEPYMIHWLEKSGYDVSYSTDIDTHANGARLLPYKALLVVGHSEYWTADMYDHVAVARDQGTDLGFFSANNAYWHVRLDAASNNGPSNRVMTVYKDAGIDPEPVFNNKTILFRDQGRAEQQLVGVQYVSYNSPVNNSALIVTNSNHWVYAGSGLTNGSSIPRLVGYEVDALMPSYPSPISTTYTTLASSPFVDVLGHTVTQQSSLYVAPSGACVFGAGTFSWSWGLDRDVLINAGIQQTTKNILDRFITACGTPGTVGPTPTPTPVTTIAPTATPNPQSNVCASVAIAPNMTIPDHVPNTIPQYTCWTMPVSNAFSVTSATLQLAISHTFVSDLVLQLRSPDGTALTLLNRAGVPATMYGSAADLQAAYPITFADGYADAELMGSTLGPTGVICKDDGQCTFAPNPDGDTASQLTTLRGFAGKASAGTWQFCAEDVASGDVGTLVTAKLDLYCPIGNPPPTPTPTAMPTEQPPPTPTPGPTNTPVPPTATPATTATPVPPTPTAGATVTPATTATPTATPTVAPTSTSVPATATAQPTATGTPLPGGATPTPSQNGPPTVSIVTPASGTLLSAGSSLNVSASASSSNGSISRVEFYEGPTLLATVSQSPYNFTWKHIPAGTTSLIAKAYDNRGASSSASVTLTAQQVCSTASGSTAGIALINRHSSAVRVLSVDSQCREVSFVTLQPGQTALIGTHNGSVWNVRDAQTSQMLITVKLSGFQSATIP